MKRRRFIQNTGLIGAGLFLDKLSFAAAQGFPEVRTPVSKRRFQSKSVESAIGQFRKKVKNEELGWLFENCFPNTLDTTVTFQMKNGRPDTYVITGDIDAMWLRDSTAQVWPYLGFIKSDKPLQDLIAGVINRQTECILKDPYANAFYNDENKVGEWKSDLTDMKPGIHERKWEIDSLCYPIRLAYHYWTITGDKSPFDSKWQDAIKSTLKVFKEQQRKDNAGPYKFQRTTAWATDGVPLGGYGYPVKPVGLICSIFRPSDDATIYPFLIPSNLFAITSLRQAAKMISAITNDDKLAAELTGLAQEVESAVQKYGIIDHQVFGKVYAFEVNGYGSFNLMDDANIPSLLSMPYLDAVKRTDPVYQNTRKLVLSDNNPFYFKGSAAEGVGSPHTGLDLIWPLGIITRGLTTDSEDEIKWCVQSLKNVHGGTGFMHESFHKDDPKKFTRAWFAWANTIFGEFLWKTYQEKPQCLMV
ncbi:glycoside hydrolase family 125 protein [Flavihumibacter sp. R14]|nr:glycoside hydrolase family 125 protein [Flavihumibacter soli]